MILYNLYPDSGSYDFKSEFLVCILVQKGKLRPWAFTAWNVYD